VAPGYRAIIGPKGMSPEQIAYWDNVFQQLVQSETWKKELERNEWESTFMKSAETRKISRRPVRGLPLDSC